MPESTCPVCHQEVPVVDRAYGIHYNSGLFRCDGSGAVLTATEPRRAPVAVPAPIEPVEKPVKKAAPRKKITPKK
jgi:hypothetical protein